MFSPEAKETVSAIIVFIRDQWGNKSAEKFVKETYNRIDLISTNPYIDRALGKDPGVRIAFITPQVSVVYKIHPEHIYLLYFWDNRQQPIP